MMHSPLLPYRLTICGLYELDLHAAAGVGCVVSILDPDFPDPVAFHHYPPHRRILYRFDDVVRDRAGVVAPAVANVHAILDLGREMASEPVEHVLIHCHAGVSRSTAAAIILMVQDNPGREAEAFAELSRIRPRSWPNALMLTLADAILARDGALTEHLREHQRRVVRSHPDLADLLIGSERAHEVLDLMGEASRYATART